MRVNADGRLIVHRMAGSLLLCYVDHHDRAHDWAERRKLETHPSTAPRSSSIRETVKEVVILVFTTAPAAVVNKARLFESRADEELLGYGVPAGGWTTMLADEDSILSLVDRLPAEAAEALLELATGGKPRVAPPPAPAESLFEHPDAQRASA